ncbi:MAG: hypothetical protein IJW97_06605 [Clostridia bacterium]|nr:hypothetical protein [Clostridia bacterium]
MKSYKLSKKMMPLAVLTVAVIALIAAVLVFVASANTDVGFRKVLYRISGVLLLVIVVLLMYYLYVSRDNDPHFFLLIKGTQKNMPLEQLTFSRVNERMAFFLEMLAEDPAQLWADGYLENNRRFLAKEAFRPLVAYKMLYDLTEQNAEDSWRLLEDAHPDTVEVIAYALQNAGERELSETLVELHKMPDRTGCENLRDFLYSNQKYLRGRMLRYVKANWEKLY